MSIGKQFLSALIAEGSVLTMTMHGNIDHLFKASEAEAWAFVRDFVKQYQKLPSPATIQTHTGEMLVPHEEPSAYYLDLMRLRHTELAVKKGMKAASDFLLPDNKDPEKALAILAEAVMDLVTTKSQNKVVDFRQAYDTIMGTLTAKMKAGDDFGLSVGWPTLDKMTGGLVKGDVLSMVGRPAAGKTMQMLYAAWHGWNKAKNKPDPDQNHSRLFVSMEVGSVAIQQRLISMQAHIPAGGLKLGELTSLSLGKLKASLTEIKGYAYPFWVVDANLTATVEDIWMLARQLNPGAIFIDGAYLLKHPTERDRFKRVAENCELIKQELAPIAPCAASWQFAKTAAKKNAKKGEKVGLEDIGYTDAIAQISSIALGLFQEDSVETLQKRKIEILKGRSGETGSFETHWNWQTMDFTEVVEEEVSELQFL